MVCFHPIKIKITGSESRFNKQWLKVPCGHCIACNEQKIKVWTYRLIAESRLYDKMSFVTLTYDDEHLTGNLNYEDIQKFFKRIRRYYDYHKGQQSIAYFGCGEYGGLKGREHWHILILGLDKDDFLVDRFDKVSHNSVNGSSPFWRCGLMSFGTDIDLSTSRLIRYVTKYVNKTDEDNLVRYCKIMEIQKPFTFCSKGIGADYLKEHKDKLPKLNGLSVTLPPYWLKKFDLSMNHDDWLVSQDRKKKFERKCNKNFGSVQDYQKLKEYYKENYNEF